MRAEWEKVPANAKTVLVVDDFDETRFTLTVLIGISGYRVAESISGNEPSSLPAGSVLT